MSEAIQRTSNISDPFEAAEANDSYGNGSQFESGGKETQDVVAQTTYHMCGSNIICGTDERGFSTPGNRSPFDLVLEASEGFIPLWNKNRVLRWSFNEMSMRYFRYPNAAKAALRQLIKEAINAWGDSAPIRFRKADSGWEFQIQMSYADNCNPNGCTLAQAFFPDQGRHRLRLFPQMFTQSRKEIVDTFIHEIGHMFGLRHFFANLSEQAWPSEIFGTHQAFTIMNYGLMSELTETDKSDLKNLYQSVWNGTLDNVNGTPIVLFDPYHYALP